MKTNLKVLFVAAEAVPFAKVGGLAETAAALPKALRAAGVDVRLMIPRYGGIRNEGAKAERIGDPIPVKAGAQEERVHLLRATGLGDVPVYQVWDGNYFSAREKVYGFNDDPQRFMFFSRSVLAALRTLDWKPDLIHANDWHTAPVVAWLDTEGRQDPFWASIATLFTIHNLAYQGPWRWYLEKITWCPWYMQGHNTMAAAVQFADRVNTVSPTYAAQIRTPEYGEKIEGLLSFISGKTWGILNGIDTESYDPATDVSLKQTFTADTIEKRDANKVALQEEVGLEVNKGAFLIGMVTRLVEQKGIDLVLQILDRFMAYTDAQFVLLGTGDRYYETAMWQLATRYPGRMATYLLYNDNLARRIYGGADAFLMPSRFEPCGISQMLAMRYGCVPIVRRTGGLVDTVSFHIPGDANHEGSGTGFCFDRYEPLDLFTCMVRAYESFRYKDDWRKLQQRGMREDFSWTKSAKQYVRMYNSIYGITEEPPDPKPSTT